MPTRQEVIDMLLAGPTEPHLVAQALGRTVAYRNTGKNPGWFLRFKGQDVRMLPVSSDVNAALLIFGGRAAARTALQGAMALADTFVMDAEEEIGDELARRLCVWALRNVGV